MGVADTIQDPDPAESSVRFERFFSYFTIWSNMLLAITCGVLVARPRLESAGWNILRVTALMSIVITGLIFFIVLRPDTDLDGARRVIGNALRHYAAPLMAVAGWAAFGPWPRQPWRDLVIVMLWPVAFGAFTLLHGAVTGWYPYDFLDVVARGYAAVSVELVVSGLEMLAVAAVFIALNRRWNRTRSSST